MGQSREKTIQLKANNHSGVEPRGKATDCHIASTHRSFTEFLHTQPV